jgi:hypothetical protein
MIQELQVVIGMESPNDKRKWLAMMTKSENYIMTVGRYSGRKAASRG